VLAKKDRQLVSKLIPNNVKIIFVDFLSEWPKLNLFNEKSNKTHLLSSDKMSFHLIRLQFYYIPYIHIYICTSTVYFSFICHMSPIPLPLSTTHRPLVDMQQLLTFMRLLPWRRVFVINFLLFMQIVGT